MAGGVSRAARRPSVMWSRRSRSVRDTSGGAAGAHHLTMRTAETASTAVATSRRHDRPPPWRADCRRVSRCNGAGGDAGQRGQRERHTHLLRAVQQRRCDTGSVPVEVVYRLRQRHHRNPEADSEDEQAGARWCKQLSSVPVRDNVTVPTALMMAPLAATIRVGSFASTAGATAATTTIPTAKGSQQDPAARGERPRTS